MVEDDPDQRRVLVLVARGCGHEVVECGLVQEAREAGPCDLSFVDFRLPDGDGLDLARSLGGRVFLLTGEEDVEAGCGVEILLKPVSPAALNALLG